MKYISILVLAMGLVACGGAAKKDCSSCKVKDGKRVKSECCSTDKKSDCTSCDVKEGSHHMKTDAELVASSNKAKAMELATGTTVTGPAIPSGTTTTSFPLMNGTSSKSTTCTAGADTRTISIVSPSHGGCAVNYSKMGIETTVATAKADMTYCERVATKIETNLQSSSFTCQ